MAFLVDSYSETNSDTDGNIGVGVSYQMRGQSFPGKVGTLSTCKFYIKRVSTATGNAVARLYSHSGTYGTSSIGDTLLASSDNYDVSTIDTSYGLITFTFSGAAKYSLTGANYWIGVYYNGGDGSKYISTGADRSSASHGGNAARNDGAWDAQSTTDYCFYVYADFVGGGAAIGSPMIF